MVLQRHARTLHALADTWDGDRHEARPPASLSPFEGADDLNGPVALQLDGVLFMEGEGRPAELGQLVRDLRTAAADQRAVGAWLASAMDASWAMAGTLVDVGELADVLGERHRIIADDWQAAGLSTLVARTLDRAADLLEHADLTPAGLRDDLAGGRVSAGLVRSAAELIDHAADLSSESAGLVHGNERRWRTFRARVLELHGRGVPA